MNIKAKEKLRRVFGDYSEVDGQFFLTKQENCQDKSSEEE